MKASGACDYIIVGAGSAGCVLANRLSADPGISVVLIEAGGRDGHPWMRMPMGQRNFLSSGRHNWNYRSEPEPALNNRRLEVPRGRVLGGTSTINGMAYSRGHSTDYDQWAQQGLDGWSWAEVLPYFKRSETNWRGAGKWHGGSGELHVNQVNTRYNLYEELRASVMAAGHPVTDDPYGDHPGGLSPEEITVCKGSRLSTSGAFLRPVMNRPNLTVQMHALTTRILMEGERAVGIEFTRNGRLHQVRAKREVILSGGTYNSPQLLMLSGIGPAEHLKSFGIRPLVDLPGVGGNFQDHPFLRLLNRAGKPVTFDRYLRYDRAVINVLRWALFGSGPFASPVTSRMFVKTQPGLARPDVALVFYPIHFLADLWLPGLTTPPKWELTCGISLLHEESRGRVSLRSANPADPPRIQFNFFDKQSDMDTLIRGLRIAREIYAQKPMASLIVEETGPGKTVTSDADLKAFVRNTVVMSQHGASTCAMGTGSEAVVDSQLRVRGTTGLRVVDTSVMPAIVGGNTNAPTIMIAEKAADMILGRAALPAQPL